MDLFSGADKSVNRSLGVLFGFDFPPISTKSLKASLGSDLVTGTSSGVSLAGVSRLSPNEPALEANGSLPNGSLDGSC